MTVAQVLMLIQALVGLVDEAAPALPVAEKLLNGQTLTSQDALAFWQTVVALEGLAAEKAASLMAQHAPVA